MFIEKLSKPMPLSFAYSIGYIERLFSLVAPFLSIKQLANVPFAAAG
jgi:hypothetical protein